MNNNKLISSLIISMVAVNVMAQTAVPHLVVGITIDNLRSDYLQAFSSLFGENGLKKLIAEGQVYSNVQYPHAHVDRASAIATIATGSTPYNHGIIAEEWIDRKTLQKVYCVDDNQHKGIGTKDNSSPQHLLVSTLGDELKMATRNKSVVYSIAPNREAAILAAGHAADWAAWIDDEDGTWAGTSYYGNQPNWFKELNKTSDLVTRIGEVKWEPTDNYIGTYNNYLAINQKPFCVTYSGSNRFKSFKTSALVNEEITRAANLCISNGYAGIDETTDYLSICYYAGNYNELPISETTTELQDTYVRLDSQIASLLKTIDRLVGLDKTLIYLTSTGYDNAPEDVHELQKYKIPTGTFTINRCAALLNMYLSAIYGKAQYVDTYFGSQIYLNHQLIEDKQLQLSEILRHSESFLFQFSGIRDVFTSERLTQGAWTPGISSMRNSYHSKCSGDITLQVVPGWVLANEDRGTSQMQRDSFFEFPLIFYGYKMPAQKISTPVTVDCIAPTIAHHIRIRAPNACRTAPLF